MAVDAAAPAPAPNFEQTLTELEQLVERMERGDLPLEEALKQFERGVELTRMCQQALAQAEQRVEQLLQQNGTAVIVPFDPAEPSGASEAEANS